MNSHPNYTKEQYDMAEEFFLRCHGNIKSKEQAIKIANIAAMLLSATMPTLMETFGKEFSPTARKILVDLDEYCAIAEKSEYNKTAVKGIYFHTETIIDLIRQEIEEDNIKE